MGLTVISDISMTTEKFYLSWNDFQQTVSNSFRTLRKETDFFDVTLVSDDEVHIEGHKLVLSASSDFFKSMLKKCTNPHPMIYLTGISFRNLQFIMDYIYQGQVEIHQEHLDNFLEVAQKLKIAGLNSTDNNTEHTEERDSKMRTNKSHVKEIPFKQEENYPSSSNHQDQSYENLGEETILATTNQISQIGLPLVDGSWANGSELDLKIQEMTSEVNGVFTCTVCGKTTKQKINLKKHIETHIEGLSFPCQQCGKTFRSRNACQIHVSRNHKL